MSKILIEHGWVIPMDGMNTVMEDGAVAIEDNRIVAVGDSEALDKNDFAANKLIDAKGKAVLPGLVNTHTHLVGAFNKGITESE